MRGVDLPSYGKNPPSSKNGGLERLGTREQTQAEAPLFTAWVRREIFLEAFFQWITFLDAALSKTDMAVFRAAWAASRSCRFTADRTALTTFLILVFMALFLDRRFKLCLCRFRADL